MVSIGSLAPEDIWMSEGKLLVLKGASSATSRQGYYDPWEPLDDYQVWKFESPANFLAPNLKSVSSFQAPYREPRLPPPDFIPEEHGVGVPLPPETESGGEGNFQDNFGGGVGYVEVSAKRWGPRLRE